MKENTICKTCRIGKLLKREVSKSFGREGLEVESERNSGFSL